jgi:uncharacterized membrane-anchored protein
LPYKSFLKGVLLIINSFSKVKTFSSFWIFSVIAEKVGEVGGDCCSGFVYKGLGIFVV